MDRIITGWDIGGAHIKAVRVACGGDAPHVEAGVIRSFDLWKAPDRLADVLADVAVEVGTTDTVAVTMTAELCDCFPSKRVGVAHVITACTTVLSPSDLRVLDVRGRWLDPARAMEVPLRVASANWVATAHLVASRVPHTVFVDVGSTTTDLIPIEGGEVCARGLTDPGRLARGELVYTGASRTNVSAVVEGVPVRGRWCRVSAEYFAVTGDVYLVLGDLEAAAYTCEPPDGGERSVEASRRRLARIICADTEMLTTDEIDGLARFVRHRQVTTITDGLLQVLSAMRPWPPVVTVTGTGKFLAEAAASQIGLPVVDLDTELVLPPEGAASAVAVAWWLAQSLDASARKP
ncbi:MAG TPA: hydantoinase/oxoprolinase family protein [bacterium]|nr:hydantoinase/oxoprolinase family protein [bacterium]